jgi:AraC-like DNA-binding protein/mannose-6-phosphate isomerase-like protein (cupin superfamily)
MKISFLREIQAKFKQPKTNEEIEEIISYIRDSGINVTDLYQELEMTSTYANIHKDITHRKINISLHSHSFYEVMLCRAADRIEYLIGSKRYKIGAGDVVIIPPGVSHMPIFPEDMQYPYDRDILWVNAAFMEKIIDLFPGFSSNRINTALLLHTKGSTFSHISDYFTDGINETLSQKAGYDKIITAHAILIISHILRSASEGEGSHFEPEKPTMINSLIEHIEGHLDERLNLDEVAARFYISRGTVNKLFKESMDTTFYKFVTQRRLILAKVLIGEGENMESVSQKCGFTDYSTFYKAFKKEYGISPREYAKI